MGEKQEAVMGGLYTDFRNSKLIAGLAIADVALALIIYGSDGALTLLSSLFANVVWVAQVLLRLFSVLAHWSAASAYLYEGSRFLEHSLRFGQCLLGLLGAIAG